MVTGTDLKRLSKSRLKTVVVLMNAQDWEAAAYMMGYVLETLLKAASCKALGLEYYPDDKNAHPDQRVRTFFMTHVFDQLLYVSGLSDIFITDNTNWSQFTAEYVGDWPGMRYDPNANKQYDQEKVEDLFKYLYSDNNSIIKTVKRRKRW